MPSSLRVLSVAIASLLLLVPLPLASQESPAVAPVVLTGRDLTVDDVVRVARGLSPVRAGAAALERVARAHDLLLLAAKRGLPIYGLNRGVGIDRDKPLRRRRSGTGRATPKAILPLRRSRARRRQPGRRG